MFIIAKIKPIYKPRFFRAVSDAGCPLPVFVREKERSSNRK
jgi:hypothetical protein